MYSTKVLANFIVKLKSIKKLESILGLYFHISFFFQTVNLKSHTFAESVLPKPLSLTREESEQKNWEFTAIYIYE